MDSLYVNGRLTIPASELDVSFARSGGPGGQNVNKVNSKVTLRWQVRDQPRLSSGWRQRFLESFGTRVNNEGEVVISSQTHREQARNIDDCRQKLADMLRQVQAPPKRRKPTKPTLGSKRRRLKAKKIKSEKKRLRGEPPRD